MQSFKEWLVLEMPMETGGPGLGLIAYGEPTPTMFVLIQNSPALRASFRETDYDMAKTAIVGVMTIRDNELYNAWETDRVWARHGFGPLLYYIAMTYAGKMGLMPNRVSSHVSDEAKNVWMQFFSGAGRDKVDVVPIIPNSTAHHSENYLMHRYVLKRKTNIRPMLVVGKRIVGNDPFGERLTFLLETAESVLQGNMEDLYPPH